MANERLSDKERALIESARRESTKGLSPLDAPTVVGWNHPAAQSVGDEKWSRVAALMETERRDAEEKRRRARRNVIVFLAVVLGLVLIAGVRLMLR